MKKKLRKLAALGLSFIMICSLLTACGSTKAPEENSAQGNGAENSGNMEEEVSGESATEGESAGCGSRRTWRQPDLQNRKL